MTGLGERPYNDSIGSPGQMGLFEIGDYPTTTVVQQQLLDAIRINEPRVTIQEIIMDNNQDNFLIVRIFFLINNLPGNYSLEVSVKRVR